MICGLLLSFSLLLNYHDNVCLAQVKENASEAFQIAGEAHRPVLLVFAGSDWCAPCMRLEKKILTDDSFKNFAELNLVILKAEFPQRKKLSAEVEKQNEALAEQYNPNGIFPYLVLLTADKQVISLINYHDQSPADFISELSAYLIKNDHSH
jgi:thioredoxin-related protein